MSLDEILALPNLHEHVIVPITGPHHGGPALFGKKISQVHAPGGRSFIGAMWHFAPACFLDVQGCEIRLKGKVLWSRPKEYGGAYGADASSFSISLRELAAENGGVRKAIIEAAVFRI